MPHIRSFTFLLMMGMLSSSFMRLLCTTGKMFLRTIFSTTSGTEMTTAGCSSAKASAMKLGLGRRVRKKMWLP